MFVAPDTADWYRTTFLASEESLCLGDRRQAHKSYRESQQQQACGDEQIRRSHCFGYPRLGNQLGRIGENEGSGNERSDGGANGVEGLRQSQAYGGAVF